MKCGIVLGDVFSRHRPPGAHPERPDRIKTLVHTIEEWKHYQRLQCFRPRPADEKWIREVHSEDHLARLRASASQDSCWFDADTYTCPESFETALMGAGSTVLLVEQLLKGRIEAGFALIRPPGHHAESNRAMGFCLVNNVAVAAQWALRQYALRKVAIVDFDVHHGNGTQEIFYSRSDVLYISIHQSPWYPGTGQGNEVGEGQGKGFTVNLPIQKGRGNHFYCSLFDDFVKPILRCYRPSLILVSAGYDSHKDDPLADMNLDENGFGQLVNVLNTLAGEVCQGRILYVLEGGYNLAALAQSVLCTIATTLEPKKFEIQETQIAEYLAYRKCTREVLSRFWPCFEH